MTREWNAASYDRVSDPQVRQGARVVDRLRVDGVAVVLDAGCGTGRVTELLLDRLPAEAVVVALDASQKMLDVAARRLAPAIAAGRVRLMRGDLAVPLPIAEPVDAIVSTATFHWLADHEGLYRNLAGVLRPGGQLVAQCGGVGCLDILAKALRDVGETWQPWNFATPEETRQRLEACGFASVDTWLHDEPARIGPEVLEEFLATVILGSHLERRPEQERAPFVRAVAAALPEPVLDYVRLNIVATRDNGTELAAVK